MSQLVSCRPLTLLTAHDMCLMAQLMVREETAASGCVSLPSAQVLLNEPPRDAHAHLYAALAWADDVRMCHPLCQLLVDQLYSISLCQHILQLLPNLQADCTSTPQPS